MKIVTSSAAVCAAAIIAVAGAIPFASLAQAVGVVAPESDYLEFRKLSGPLRLVDLALARDANYTFTQASTKDRTPEWQAAFIAAMERRTRARGDAFVDAAMHDAFRSFNRQDVARLTIIFSKPLPARIQSLRIKLLRDNADPYDIQQTVETDPEVLAMPAADRDLMLGLLAVTDKALASDRVSRDCIQYSSDEADAAYPQPPERTGPSYNAPPGWVPPVLGPDPAPPHRP